MDDLPRHWRHATRSVLGGLVLSLAACGSDPYETAELPNLIFVSDIHLGESMALPTSFVYAGQDVQPGRCCSWSEKGGSFDAERDAPVGRPVTGQDILAALDPDATFYRISIPPPGSGASATDVDALLRPVFGGRRMRRHTMVDPQEGCRVVSGVRDAMLRVGVIAHEVEVERRYQRYGKEQTYTIEELNSAGVQRCIISAVLLMHGLPEDEAMDFEPYTINHDGRTTALVPDYSKVHARAAELGKAPGDG